MTLKGTALLYSWCNGGHNIAMMCVGRTLLSVAVPQETDIAWTVLTENFSALHLVGASILQLHV
jgi:hypothetical protein